VELDPGGLASVHEKIVDLLTATRPVSLRNGTIPL
jgi:hypothetical protein